MLPLIRKPLLNWSKLILSSRYYNTSPKSAKLLLQQKCANLIKTVIQQIEQSYFDVTFMLRHFFYMSHTAESRNMHHFSCNSFLVLLLTWSGTFLYF